MIPKRRQLNSVIKVPRRMHFFLLLFLYLSFSLPLILRGTGGVQIFEFTLRIEFVAVQRVHKINSIHGMYIVAIELQSA